MYVLKAVDEELEKIVKKSGYSELSNFTVNSSLAKLKKEVELKLFTNIGNDEKKILFSTKKARILPLLNEMKEGELPLFFCIIFSKLRYNITVLKIMKGEL